MFICIAGKNECSINAIKILTKNKINNRNIYVLPNSSDNGRDGWQPSLKKFAIKNKIKIIKPERLYSIKMKNHMYQIKHQLVYTLLLHSKGILVNLITYICQALQVL